MNADPGEDKREIPVDGRPPEDATRLYKSLTPTLSQDDETSLAHRVTSDYHSGIQDRSEWENRLAEWEDAYYGRLPEKDFPWEGCSNFHVPLTMMGIETLRPRLKEGVLGQDPPIIVLSTTQSGEERKEVVEAFLNWQIKNQMNLEPKVDESSHFFLQPGIAIAKVYWRVQRFTRKYVREFEVGTPLEQVVEALFGEQAKIRNFHPTGFLTWAGEIPTTVQGGAPLQFTLELAFIEDEVHPVIQAKVIKEEVVEQPDVDLIDPPDFISPAKGGSNVNDLPWCQHRLWMSDDMLRKKAELGVFDKDVVQEILDTGTPKGDLSQQDAQAYRSQQSATEGVEDQGPSNVKQTQFEVLEDYRLYDIDRDGMDEQIITWVCPNRPDRILGWDYLDNVYAHGRRPFRIGKYHAIPGRFLGLSFAEVIKGIQDEINTMHNQRVDYGTIQNLPFGFKRANSALPEISQKIKPGEFLDVENPQQDIFIPKWQGSPAWGQQEEAVLMQYFERLTGLTDLSVGKQPNRVGATRTAAGTQTLLAEGGLRFKMAMAAFQQFWIGIFEDILALDQEYLPPELEFRVTGKRPPYIKVKDRMEIRGKFDLRLAASTETMNRGKMREDAQLVMQAVMNPMALQMGLIGLKGLRRAYNDLFRAYAKDPDFYLEPKDYPKSPVEELQSFVRGVYVSPVMGEDIQAHMMAHQQALMDPIVPPQVKQLLQRHLQETQQVAQMQQMAMQMQQSQKGKGGPPMGQQGLNADRGRQPQSAPGQPTPQIGPPGGPPTG